MESDDESQEVSSGNDSEAESGSEYLQRTSSSVGNQLKQSSSRESSPSRSNSYNSENSPRSPVSPPESPKSSTSNPNARNSNRGSSLSQNSSRSNSPLVGNNYAHNNDNKDDDSQSVKSQASSHKSLDNEDNSSNNSSVVSRASKDARKSANLDDGNTSDSSLSLDGSSDANKRTHSKEQEDIQPEEISDGDIELSDHEKVQPAEVCDKRDAGNINMAHEDLSDVSDLEDSIDHSDDYGASKHSFDNDDDNEGDKHENKSKKTIDRTTCGEDGEEQLDFEAEDGECAENESSSKKKEDDDRVTEHEAGELEDDVKQKEKTPEELEEGELTDEDDVRPEEVEPRPVCRFFSRGQCTWGASCRFLHPGVTDKGNYTMFDLVRPVIPGDYANDRLVYGGNAGAGRADPPPVESAWERGLRTAKEMMRKSIKRKEQDIDFEEKKMNLSLAQEELDKENGYYAKAPSPEPRYVSMRHSASMEYPPMRIPPEEYYGRRQVIYESEYPAIPRERAAAAAAAAVRTYREVVPHRQPPEYYNKHEEEPSLVAKARRPKREVIVQRVEERSSTRADEWSDPWMRSKSPAGRKASRRRSYTSASSYSSSSSSRSSSVTSRSSYRSRSRSSHHKRRSRSHRRQVSPSVIVSERKAANERAALMNPPAPRKKAPSPGMMRVGAQNPPAPAKVDQFGRTRSKLAVAAALARVKGRARSSRSSSGSSSGSSSSDSDSSGSSSSSSRNGTPSPRRPSGVDLAIALKAKAIDALKSGSEKRQIKLNLKNSMVSKKPDFSEIVRKAEVTQNRKRTATSPPAVDPKSIINKKASSRREELLKQLKAVEDAIAKKRSKVN